MRFPYMGAGDFLQFFILCAATLAAIAASDAIEVGSSTMTLSGNLSVDNDRR